MEPSQATQELLIAAQRCFPWGVQNAIEQGADIRALGKGGRSALSLVIGKAREAPMDAQKCVQALLAKGDARMADEDGVTPLMRAASTLGGAEAALPMVSLLLPASDPLAVSKSGRTALMHACMGGNEGVLSLLLPVSDAHARNVMGETALMTISEGGNKMGMARILAPASDLNAQDNAGKVAVQYFLGRGALDVALMLLPGTNLMAKRPDGVPVGKSVKREQMALLKIINESGSLIAGGKGVVEFGVRLTTQLEAQKLGEDLSAARLSVSADSPRARL